MHFDTRNEYVYV